jgi:hypothetical protein
MEITTLLIIAVSLLWLGYETNYFSIRLPYGAKIPAKTILLLPCAKVEPILMLPVAISRYKLSMTIDEWKVYDDEHAQELEQSQREWAKNQAKIKARTCPICKKQFENPIIKNTQIIRGNSVCNVIGCPDCVAEFQTEIEKSQSKHKSTQSVKAPCSKPTEFITTETVRISRNETRTESRYHDSLVPKEWLEKHHSDIIPEATIELIIDGKEVAHFNGNFKTGCLREILKPKQSRIKVLSEV